MEIKDNATYSSLEKESNDSYKKVKGPSKGKTIGLIIAFSIIGGYLLVFSLMMFLDTALLKSNYTEQEELTTVEGVVDSVKVRGHEYGLDAAIKLKDNEEQFIMPTLAYKACDKSIETDDLNGSFVYMSVYENTVYSFKTDEKVYLTFDGYLNTHKKDVGVRYGIGAATCIIGFSCIVVTILSARHLKKIKQINN